MSEFRLLGPKFDQADRTGTDTARSEIELNDLWTTQVTRLLGLGLDRELGYESPKDYMDSLPQFTPKLPEFEGRVDDPMIIETRIPLERLAQLAGITFDPALRGRIRDWSGGNFTTPKDPYSVWVGIKPTGIPEPVIWINLGEDDAIPLEEIKQYMFDSNNDTSIPVIRKYLKSDERGATALEGIFYYLNNRRIFSMVNPEKDSAPDLFMVGTENFDEYDEEQRLFLGRYRGGEIWLTNNGDPVEAPHAGALSLVVGRQAV